MARKLLSNVIVAVFAVATALVGWMMLRSDTEEALPTAPTQTVEDDTGGEGGPEVDKAKPRPNIVFITVDTLRVDRLGVYGHAQAETPAVDALAGRGIRFEQATVPFPRTTPAMASLFTGLWPQHHGSREVWERIEHGKLLAEVLKGLGYDTAGVSSNSACGSKQKFNRGFRLFRQRKQLGRPDADRVTKHALKLVKKAAEDKPLFLWAHYVDPHWPYDPPRKFKPQPEAPKCRKLRSDVKKKTTPMGHLLSNTGGIARDALEECQQMYDAEIAFADVQIARLLAGLEDAGRMENTIVVFTSDHGENMGEDGYWFGHGPSVHDAAIRVPLIIAGPGVPAGKVDDGIARIEDVVPTILEMLEVPRDDWPQIDGTSLQWRWNSDALRPKQPIHAAFAESGTPLRALSASHLVSGRRGQYCIHDERYSICRIKESKHEGTDNQADDKPDESDEADGKPDEADGKPDEADGKPDEADGKPDGKDDEADDEADDKPDDVGKDDDHDEGGAVAPSKPSVIVTVFYDRKRDPDFDRPVDSPPAKVRARLEQALEIWKPETARQRSVRTPKFKVVDYPKIDGGYRRELYDLVTDPKAERNIWDDNPRKGEELAELLERWAADLPVYEARERSEEDIEELRALGYIR